MNPASHGNSDRRSFLQTAGGGAGLLAYAMLQQSAGGANVPTQQEQQHRARTQSIARAKRVIWLFMHGGPSHVDLFDPKPALTQYSGQPLPDSFGLVMTRRDVARNPLLAPIKRFRPRGKSGLEVSDFLPQIADCADDLFVIRSLHGDSVNHPQSVYQMNTGSILMGNPSVGSWVAYGLGTENQSLPAFVVLSDPGGGVKGGPPAWGSGYLPATWQGVTIRPGKAPILNLNSSAETTRHEERRTLDFIQSLNRRHLQQRDQDDRLTARINAYELAFRMQATAPELVDISGETQETLHLYGIDEKETQEFGTRCLLARRMAERGVRFIQLYSGDTNGWDAHSDVAKNHGEYCRRTDRPVAGLLKDLKQRGLLDDTLVIWGGEFGRMPMSEQGKGRDHNPWGFTMWLAGAGIEGGRFWGATDEIGLRAEIDRVSVNQFHATILNLLGIDHDQLSYYFNGLDKKLTGPD
ncbi:MAG: DUF1501 domain-containing protein, partial [Planctomycetaceae bacterium]|nr:DUF1501 domain-containing protein [Planctomycetaceae bacterium]